MNLKNLYCCYGFLGILLSGCSKEQSDNTPKVVWQAHINLKTTIECFKPILYRNKVIVSIDSTKTAETLLFFDKNTGQLLQKWSDPIDNQKDGIASYKTYLHNNYLTFGVKNKTYIVNLDDATTKMKTAYAPFYGCMRDVEGLGSKVFRVLCNGAQDDASEDYLTEYDIETGAYRIVLSEKGKNGYQTGVNNPTVHRNTVGDTMLTYANVFYHYGKKDTKPLLMRYNLSRKEPLPPIVLEPSNPWYGVSRNTLLDKNQLYLFLGEQLCCFNVETGLRIWSKRFSTLFSDVTPIVMNDKLYVTNEDGFLYGLNANDGTELWKTKVSGTCSDPEYLNGVIYVVGGGDGLLHAVDANTGAHLYKFRCPDEAVNSDFWWQRNVTVDASTKRLYVASYGSLFCLEAVR